MNDLCRSALYALHDHVVVLGKLKLHDHKQLTAHFVFKRLLTQLALETLPKEALDSLATVNQAFAIQPALEAPDVDAAHGPSALTGTDQLLVILPFSVLRSRRPSFGL